MARVLMPLPDHDFDTTESAVPWKKLVEAGHEVIFATEEGAVPACDPRLLGGVLFGQLGAEPEAKAFYAEMSGSSSFLHPLRWRDLAMRDYDALVLAGGHAPGMRQYLGNETLHAAVNAFDQMGKPIGAICHGVLVMARAAALKSKKTTCLPKYMERTAYFLTAWKLGTYYRTYPAYVEEEVIGALDSPADFVRGPITLTKRGTHDDDTHAFVVEDGHYVSARWPGDAYLFAKKLLARI